jgi:hypothetical protein
MVQHVNACASHVGAIFAKLYVADPAEAIIEAHKPGLTV